MKPFVAKKIGLFDPQNAQLCLVHLAMAFTGLPWITHPFRACGILLQPQMLHKGVVVRHLDSE